MRLITKTYRNKISIFILGFAQIFAGLVSVLTLGFYQSHLITIMLCSDGLNALEEWEDRKGI